MLDRTVESYTFAQRHQVTELFCLSFDMLNNGLFVGFIYLFGEKF